MAAALLWCAAGCRASPPGTFESKLADAVKRNITVGGSDDRNPLPPRRETVERGLDLFTRHCAACHGLDGQSTGVPFADTMSPPVPSLASPLTQEYADGQLKWIVENGISPSGMPAWKGILEDGEMWAIVHYIRHLPPKGSLGVPSFYEGIRQRGMAAPLPSNAASR